MPHSPDQSKTTGWGWRLTLLNWMAAPAVAWMWVACWLVRGGFKLTIDAAADRKPTR